MTEELYIIDGSKRLKVDLSIPSGITLSFQSNIFGDLSKITCSHTYTFKLPLTANNRRVFDNADDIRCVSDKIRKRLTAEYIQNGIPLFRNANIYIESTDTSFNAIMTWGVIGGLQVLKDNDCSIQELPNENTETTLGPYELNQHEGTAGSRGDSGGISDTGETVHAFDNLAVVLGPDYNCGIPYRKWKLNKFSGYRSAGYFTGYATYPMPVVPVYKIISLINQKFETSFKLGKHLTNENISTLDPLQEAVEVGVIPLVSTRLNEAQLSKRTATFKNMTFVAANITLNETAGDQTTTAVFPDALSFGSVTVPYTDYFDKGQMSLNSSITTMGIIPKISGMSLEIDGHLRVCFENYYQGNRNNPSEPPELRIYQKVRSSYRPNVPGYRQTNRAYYEWREVCSLTGESDGKNGDYYIYDFNFCQAEMFERLKCDNVGSYMSGVNGPLVFAFSAKINGIVYQSPITVHLVNEAQAPYKMDVISNLPDISCLTFMKSLFYMIGAFPSVDAEGNIVPVFYSTIQDNLLAGNTIDWSKKIYSDVSELPIKTQYASGDYAQNNLYIMKSDNDGGSKDNDGNLVYESGKGVLQVANQTLALSKTIIQLPFYAPLLYDKENMSYDMGQTFQCWTLEKDDQNRVSRKWVDPKPCFGLIRVREVYVSVDNGPYTVNGTVMSMIVWNGFTQFAQNKSYSYLQKIMSAPTLITENLRLNEHDLRNLDYSVPVYLSKYSAYFAIVSITRDSKGISKCELLKLPEEEYYG